MRKWVFVVHLWIVGVLFAAWVGQAADIAIKFPATEPGRHAEAWFQAYNAGEDAMKAFLPAHVAPAGLKRRPVEARLDIYRSMREEHGALTPIRVAEDGGESSVTIIARTANGPALSIQFDCEPEAPHGLLGLLVMDADAEPDQDVAIGARPMAEPDEPEDPSATSPLTDKELAASLAGLTDSLAASGAFSGAVLLAHDDAPLLRKAVGLADRGAKRANRPDTKFNLGSINKIFTEVAVLQLAEQGKLKPTDTIDRYLPDYPKEKGSKITIQMLVEHRGGTGDIFRPGFEAKRRGFHTTADWYAYVRDLPLDFEPGTKRAYSNAGYVLLGAIIERASGMDYYRYMREKIFGPAGMTDTDSYAFADRVSNRAVGYTTKEGRLNSKDGPLRSNEGTLPARGSAAGGGYSTVDDLSKFVAALRAGKLLDAEHASRFVGPHAGLGIAGGSPGVNAALEVSGPYTVVILANLDPPAAEKFMGRARRLLRRAEGMPRRQVRTSMVGGPGAPGAPNGGPGRGPVGEPDDGPLMKPEHSSVPPEGVEVPMELATHLPAIEVMVNGKGPFKFAIDTGGSGVARVDSALAAQLGLPVVGEVWGGDPSGKNRRRMDVVGLQSIEIGGARFETLHASTRNYNEPGRMHGVDGILGFGLFSGYTVTFDYPAGRLRIEPTALPPVDGKRVLDYTDADGIPSIHIQVGTMDMVAHVDAGSMGGFILPERVLDQLPLAGPPKVVGKARTVSNTFEIKAAPLKGTLTIGDIAFEDPSLEFQPIMPDANVGSRILRDFRLSFDTKNKRIRFTRAS